MFLVFSSHMVRLGRVPMFRSQQSSTVSSSRIQEECLPYLGPCLRDAISPLIQMVLTLMIFSKLLMIWVFSLTLWWGEDWAPVPWEGGGVKYVCILAIMSFCGFVLLNFLNINHLELLRAPLPINCMRVHMYIWMNSCCWSWLAVFIHIYFSPKCIMCFFMLSTMSNFYSSLRKQYMIMPF